MKNSLLQTIVRLAKEGRILMRATKEKEVNGSRRENAATKVKKTNDRSKDDFQQFYAKNQKMISMGFWMSGLR